MKTMQFSKKFLLMLGLMMGVSQHVAPSSNWLSNAAMLFNKQATEERLLCVAAIGLVASVLYAVSCTKSLNAMAEKNAKLKEKKYALENLLNQRYQECCELSSKLNQQEQAAVERKQQEQAVAKQAEYLDCLMRYVDVVYVQHFQELRDRIFNIQTEQDLRDIANMNVSVEYQQELLQSIEHYFSECKICMIPAWQDKSFKRFKQQCAEMNITVELMHSVQNFAKFMRSETFDIVAHVYNVSSEHEYAFLDAAWYLGYEIEKLEACRHDCENIQAPFPDRAVCLVSGILQRALEKIQQDPEYFSELNIQKQHELDMKLQELDSICR